MDAGKNERLTALDVVRAVRPRIARLPRDRIPAERMEGGRLRPGSGVLQTQFVVRPSGPAAEWLEELTCTP